MKFFRFIAGLIILTRGSTPPVGYAADSPLVEGAGAWYDSLPRLPLEGGVGKADGGRLTTRITTKSCACIFRIFPLLLAGVLFFSLSTQASGNGVLLGGIVPHHDIAIDMIARFYDELRSRGGAVRRVFLFSPDHFRRVRRYAAVCPSDWMLSGGVLSADAEAVSALSGSNLVETTPEIFEREHGITIHIPLIAEYFPGASVVPILLRSNIPDMALMSLRRRLLGIMREGDIIILSMDLSHYKPPEGLAREDERTIEALTGMRAMETGTLDIDARRAAALALILFGDLGAKRGELLERTDSSSILGERMESGTSYAAIIFFRE